MIPKRPQRQPLWYRSWLIHRFHKSGIQFLWMLPLNWWDTRRGYTVRRCPPSERTANNNIKSSNNNNNNTSKRNEAVAIPIYIIKRRDKACIAFGEKGTPEAYFRGFAKRKPQMFSFKWLVALDLLRFIAVSTIKFNALIERQWFSFRLS